VADFVWTPTADQVESANLTRLARRLGVERYDDLHRISIEEPERFWPALVEDLGIEFSEPWTEVVDVSGGREWAKWFVGAKLNLAWDCVHRWAAGELAEEEAAVWQSEDGLRVALTWRELSEAVYRLAEGLASVVVTKRDDDFREKPAACELRGEPPARYMPYIVIILYIWSGAEAGRCD